MSGARSRARMYTAIVPLLLLLLGQAPAVAQEPYQPTLERIDAGGATVFATSGPSPDGRWIAFSQMDGEDRASLWIMPAAGGAPVQLLGGGYLDMGPTWSSDGGRIFFVSNRPARAGDTNSYAMSLPIDTETGRVAGSPRQLTLDHVTPAGVAQSPDGRHIAYGTRDDQFAIRVIPASGGNARTIHETPDWLFNVGWSSDGDAVLFSSRPQGRDLRIAYRVPAAGGTAVELFRTEKNIHSISPDGRLFVTMEPGPGARERTFEVVTVNHDVLARFTTSHHVGAARLARDGRTLFGTEMQVEAAIRVVPIDGGAPRTVLANDFYNWPIGWTADGSAVVIQGAEGDREAMVVARPDGRIVHSTPLPRDGERPRWFHATSDYALYEATIPGTDRQRLVSIRRGDNSTRVLSENFVRPTGGFVILYGRGGNYVYDDGEFLFLEPGGEGYDIRAARGDGTSRLVRSFPDGFPQRSAIGVHGERVAFVEPAGDAARLMVADGPQGAPRQVGSLQGPRQGVIAFSHDGRYIVTTDHGTGRDDESRLAIFEVPADGQPAGAPRIIETGAQYWYDPQWLPDNSGLTVIGGWTGLQTHVLHIPLQEGSIPVKVTREDPSPRWGHLLSPDGRYVVYPAEVYRGGALWTADLSPALARLRR
jgi:Tol biopolymer transport system component